MVVVVSFFDYDMFDIVPRSRLRNYADLFRSDLTYALYLKTIKFALIVWAITLRPRLHGRLLPGLPCPQPALADRAVPALHGAVLDLEHHPHDLLDPVPRPERLFNQALMRLGITDQPLEFLLFSDFAVVVAYVHLFTLFMIVPIFNSMARIDPSLLEAAVDGGASGLAGGLETSSCRCRRPASRSARSSSSRW